MAYRGRPRGRRLHHAVYLYRHRRGNPVVGGHPGLCGYRPEDLQPGSGRPGRGQSPPGAKPGNGAPEAQGHHSGGPLRPAGGLRPDQRPRPAAGLFVLEDAAQSFGATYQGRRAGALAEVAATSFFPAKPLGGYGDGGAIFTDNDYLAEVLNRSGSMGRGPTKYENVRLGLNGRLDTLQAAILLAKLEIFDQEVAARQKVAQRYSEALHPVVEVPLVARPAPRSGPSIRCSASIGSFCSRNCRMPASPRPSIIPCPCICRELLLTWAISQGTSR